MLSSAIKSRVLEVPEVPRPLEALDPTTPWYEFLSYCEVCQSLGVAPSVGRFIRYQNYLKTITR
jgi:hypothetical protein